MWSAFYVIAFLDFSPTDYTERQATLGLGKHSCHNPAIYLFIFDVGDIYIKDISHWNPGVDVGQSKHFSSPAFLIRHPKGDLLWDTGVTDNLIKKPEGSDSPLMLIKATRTLQSQLSEINVKPEEIEYLAFSHRHSDHIGNANYFVNSTLLVQEEEYASLFEGNLLTFTHAIKSNAVVQLKGDYDVFGDSSVVILRTPGHTSGHQSLLVNLPESGTVIISGDLFHFQKNRRLMGVPEFNFNREQTLASMTKIEKLIKEKNAILWIQHDKELMQAIPKSPNAIR